MKNFNLKTFDSPVRGRIKEGMVAAIKAKFDDLVEVETRDTAKELKRLKKNCPKQMITPGSGKKSRRRNVKKSVSDSSQKKILDFYRGLKASREDDGAS